MFLIIPVILVQLSSLLLSAPQHCWNFANTDPFSDQCGTLNLEQGSNTAQVECTGNGCHFQEASYLKASFPPNLEATWTFAFWIRDYGVDRSSVLSFVPDTNANSGFRMQVRQSSLKLHSPNIEITGLSTSFVKDTWLLFYSFSDAANNEAGIGGYSPTLGYQQKTLTNSIDLSIYQTGYYLRIGSRNTNNQGLTLIRQAQIYIGSAFKSLSQINTILQSVTCPALLSIISPACSDYLFKYDLVGNITNPVSLYDSSPNGLHITNYTATVTDKGLKFEQGQYAMITPLSLPSLGFALQFYLTLDSITSTQLLFTGQNNSLYILFYTIASQQYIGFLISSKSGSIAIKISIQEWNHYAMSFMKVGPQLTYISLYINGTRVGDTNIDAEINSPSSLKIGEYLEGTMQQLHLYLTPLADQTFSNYVSYMPLICSSNQFHESTSNSCHQCPLLCQSCTSSSLCTSCLANASQSSGLCSCNTGFFNQAGTCTRCISNCDQCSDTSTCSKCSSSFYLLNGNSCVQSCPAGFYSNQAAMTCEPCTEANCSKCSNTPSTCQECDTSARYFISVSGACQFCDPSFFLTPNSCSSCTDTVGAALSQNGDCIDICGDSIIIDSECDDGNTISGDGCDSECKVQPGYLCDPICSHIIPLSISALRISSDFTLQVFLSSTVEFQELQIESLQLSISENQQIFSPELIDSPLSGNFSSFELNLNPTASISQGDILTLKLETSSLSSSSKLISIPLSLSSQTELPSFQFISEQLSQAISTAGAALDYGTLLLTIGISVGQLLLQSSMEPLWSLINLNQLIFMLPLLSVDLPKNALIAFQILGIANGDMALLEFIYSHSVE